MKINGSNSLLASRNLASTSQAISRALERLSSGKRVNSPRDGVADYSASVRLDSQIRGLSQVNLGINRAQGMLQVTDSAIANQLDIVQRMREIAVEGANGTLDTSARKSLNSELQSLLQEFDRITKTTDFDGRKLLDGSNEMSELLLDQNGSSLSFATPDLKLTEAFKKTIGTGSFTQVSTLAAGAYPYSLMSVDANNDGHADLVLADLDDETLSIFKGNGDGSFQMRQTYSTGDVDERFNFGDLNNDGNIDFVVTNRDDDTISVLLGNGDGSLKAKQTYLVGDAPHDLRVQDFDQDGNMDVVVTDYTDGSISVLMGNGDGTLQNRQTYATGSLVASIETGDLDGDGVTDLAVLNEGDNTVSILLGNGDGSFQAQVTRTLGDTPRDLELKDINNDGSLDIISADIGTDESISIFLGNGDSTFGALSTLSAGSQAREIDFGDINGDSNLDMIISDSDANDVTIRQGNGDGSFGSELSYAVGTDPAGLTINDFNSDGVLDFVVGNFTSDNLSYFQGQTKTATSLPDVHVLDSGSSSELTSILDSTEQKLVEARVDLNIVSSRLDQTSAANLTRQESLTSAKSQIQDADFALETAELVRNQVLQQAQVAVQGQANVQLQVVLGLLNF